MKMTSDKGCLAVLGDLRRGIYQRSYLLIRSIFTSVGMSFFSFCNPSLGLTWVQEEMEIDQHEIMRIFQKSSLTYMRQHAYIQSTICSCAALECWTYLNNAYRSWYVVASSSSYRLTHASSPTSTRCNSLRFSPSKHGDSYRASSIPSTCHQS